MSNESVTDSTHHHAPHDRGHRGFDAYLARMRERFLKIPADTPLFRVDAPGLFATYLSRLPDRQYHNCTACRHFFERYGSLVTIDEYGAVYSAIWQDIDMVPSYYEPAIRAVQAVVENGKIEGVFLSNLRTYGTPETNTPVRWTHFAVVPDPKRRYTRRDINENQAMAAKREDVRTVSRALSEWSVLTMEKLESLISAGLIKTGVEKVQNNAKWLLELRRAVDAIKVPRSRGNGDDGGPAGRRRNAVIWRAVATAPAGFCHPRASVLGTLLDDIEAGKTVEQINAAFAAKTHGLAYQRPQAAPTEGAINQAEKLFESLGLAPALDRRFARMEDVLAALWRPQAPEEPKTPGGVFGSLRKRAPETDPTVSNSTVAVSRVKFERDVMPNVLRMEALVPHHGAYVGLVTATDPEAPPLLAWDHEDARNPVSWYFYNGGSSAMSWNLRGHVWTEALAYVRKPCHWTRDTPNFNEQRLLLLAGAADQNRPSLALFPNCVRGELHGVRSVIEAFSRRGTPKRLGTPVAGIAAHGITLRVHLDRKSVV